MSLEHCLRLERWQGPPHVNKLRSVSAFSIKTKRVCLDRKKHQPMKIDHFWLKLHSAPLIWWWQGPPHVNKVKQYDIVSSAPVSKRTNITSTDRFSISCFSVLIVLGKKSLKWLRGKLRTLLAFVLEVIDRETTGWIAMSWCIYTW